MTENKDGICCSWYESCIYYMQCEHLYNENKDLSEDVYRLEQENEKLKKEVKQIGSDFIKKGDYARELEQENKELKEEIQFHNKEGSNLLAERNAAQIGYDEIREVRERYRSALEEIRKIAENAKEYRYATKSEDYTEGMHIIGCYVLTKINEVLNEVDR